MSNSDHGTGKKPSYGKLLQESVITADRLSGEEKRPARPGTPDSIAARFNALKSIAKKGS